MFFNSMNLDLINGGAILGQDFKVFWIRIFPTLVCTQTESQKGLPQFLSMTKRTATESEMVIINGGGRVTRNAAPKSETR